MKKAQTATIFAAMLALVFAAPPSANATLLFSLDTVFNGTAPTSTSPWLTASFANAGANTVTLTLTSSLGVASEFIDEVNFNVDPSIVPSSLTITEGAHVGSGDATITATTQDAQNLTGGGNAGFGFDISIEFPTAPPPDRFDGTEVAVFTIMGTGLTENAFNFTNTGSAAAHVGAHVQGIPSEGGTTSGAIKDSGNVVVVPEPASLALLGLGLASLGFARRRKLH